MPAFEVVVAGDPAHVRHAAIQALEMRQLRFTWYSPWHALAERGSKFAGALAQYFAIEVQVMSGHHPGQTIVRFTRVNAGLTGGVIGVSMVQNNFTSLRNEFASWFHQQGMLISLHDYP